MPIETSRRETAEKIAFRLKRYAILSRKISATSGGRVFRGPHHDMSPLGFGQVEPMSARVLDIRAKTEELSLRSSDDRAAV